MRKLLQGIVEFREQKILEYREKYADLALGQAPDSLFVACSDSRVVPNLFASTNPGDLFVIRNMGNLIPPCAQNGLSVGDESEAAAIEFALYSLHVSDIIICGHSECGAMRALCNGRENIRALNMSSWLQHGEDALKALKENKDFSPHLTEHNRLSQINVLKQLEHMASYPVVKERLAQKKVRLHGWWFDLATADVYLYEQESKKFVLIDAKQVEKMLPQT